MRVNIYGEEYDDLRIEVVEKHVDDYTFYGLRLYLRFPNQQWWLHRKVDGVEDDDSSAITIWGRSKDQIAELLTAMLAVLLNVPRDSFPPRVSHLTGEVVS